MGLSDKSKARAEANLLKSFAGRGALQSAKEAVEEPAAVTAPVQNGALQTALNTAWWF